MKEGPSALLAGAAVLTAGAIGARNGPQRPVEAGRHRNGSCGCRCVTGDTLPLQP